VTEDVVDGCKYIVPLARSGLLKRSSGVSLSAQLISVTAGLPHLPTDPRVVSSATAVGCHFRDPARREGRS
jgi:hypothetical protein